jgi:hypothetical protein
MFSAEKMLKAFQDAIADGINIPIGNNTIFNYDAHYSFHLRKYALEEFPGANWSANHWHDFIKRKEYEKEYL